MAGLHAPHPLREHPDATRTAREAFWVATLGAIGCYAFFVALGAFSPGEVAGATIAVAVLAVLWIGHVVLQRRIGGAREARELHARERRGF